ncbi:MAG: hypothetical protein LUQ22_02610 [Methanotrichaceae archaeon]|nr:hypothetical protein [Methanotrichaceae archaeon]
MYENPKGWAPQLGMPGQGGDTAQIYQELDEVLEQHGRKGEVVLAISCQEARINELDI